PTVCYIVETPVKWMWSHSGMKKQLGIEVKWGYHRSIKPRHIKEYITLDKQTLPLFLASFQS
ncbi:MAG: hypothetical protein QW613_07400, partial [Thermoprotei archaeon]